MESTEPVRLLDPDTMQPTTRLDFPGGKPVCGVDVQFSADGRYLAATMHTVTWRRDATRDPGLRGGLGPPLPVQPPVRVPTGNVPPGDGAQPGRPDPVHGLAADGVRRGDGRADLAARGRHACPTLDVNAKGTLLALGDDDDV